MGTDQNLNYAVPSHHVFSDGFTQLQQSSLSLWNLLLLLLPEKG